MSTWVEKFTPRVLEILKSQTLKFENIPTDEIRIKKILHELIKQHPESETNILPELPATQLKNPQSSAQYLQQGNKWFENKKFDKAHNCYTQAIASALPSSSQHSNLLFSRSKLLFNAKMYAACLADIERINIDLISDNSKAELYMQEAMCHKYLASEAIRISRECLPFADELSKKHIVFDLINRESIQGDTEKYFNRWDMTGDKQFCFPDEMENSLVPGLCNKVEVKYTKKSGRHVVAKEDIPVGTVIGVQKPYLSCVKVEFRYNFCYYCTKQTWASVFCDDCDNCIFCSESCREKAIYEYHDIECLIIKQLSILKVNNGYLMPLKLAIMGFKENGYSVGKFRKNMSQIDAVKNPMKKGLINGKIDSKKFSSIYILSSAYNPNIPEKSTDQFTMSIIVAYALSSRIGLFKNEATRYLKLLQQKDDFIFLVALIEKLIRVSMCNSCGINMPMMNCTMNLFCSSYSLLPAFSFFNHSCDGSFIRTFCTGSMMLTTIKPIKKGDEIFDNYGMGFQRYGKEQRQQSLYLKYDSICKCIPCVENWVLENSEISEDKKFLRLILNELEKYHREMVAFRMKACEFYSKNNKIMDFEELLHKKFRNYITTCFLNFKENSKHSQMAMNLYAEYLVTSQVPYMSLDIRETTEL